VPTRADFCEPHRWPDLDWDGLAARHGLQRHLLDLVADPADFDTFAEWRDATQRYQAELLRRQVEALRRLKYRPTGGFAQFLLADARPAISHSVLGHDRRPKLGHAALAAACRPVIVVADPLPADGSGHTGAHAHSHELDVHVVSDLRTPITGARLTAEVAVDGAVTTRRWAGDIPADACIRIGAVDVPHVAGATELRLVLAASDGTVVAENTYRRSVGHP
jgi:beta-mannosidase